MPIVGDIKNLYSDVEKTRALFPTTKIEAVSDEDGTGLNIILDKMVYTGEAIDKAEQIPVNADTLDGKPANEYATKSHVAAEIAKAQLSGGEGEDIDLSGYATKDDVNDAVRAIDFPVDSVNGKTGAVELTASEVGAHPDTWLPTIAQIGAAPAGYGLGETAKYPTDNDVHSITRSGWYLIGQSTQNAFGTYGAIQANVYDDSNIVLFFYGNGGVTHARKIKRYGTWGEWEYINPKMELGVEYRTTERWNGKVVYTKLIDLGALPNNTEKSVAHGIANLENALSISAFAKSADWQFTLPSSYAAETKIVFAPQAVTITTAVDRSAYNGYATLKYTKQ